MICCRIRSPTGSSASSSFARCSRRSRIRTCARCSRRRAIPSSPSGRRSITAYFEAFNQGQRQAGGHRQPRADRRDHRDRYPHDQAALRVRHHRARHRIPGLHRRTGSTADPRSQRAAARDKWEDVSSFHHGGVRCRVPQPLHDHRARRRRSRTCRPPSSRTRSTSWTASRRWKPRATTSANRSRDAEEAWVAHTADIHRQTLMAQGDKVHSWMMGANLEQQEAPGADLLRRCQRLLRQAAGVRGCRFPRGRVRAAGRVANVQLLRVLF